jgi:hypothetical protein
MRPSEVQAGAWLVSQPPAPNGSLPAMGASRALWQNKSIGRLLNRRQLRPKSIRLRSAKVGLGHGCHASKAMGWTPPDGIEVPEWRC